MALFDASAILADVTEEKIIECDFFVLPEGVDVPTLTIEINNKIRKLAKDSESKNCGDIRIDYGRKGKDPHGIIVNNRERYCKDILEVSYIDSSGLFEQPSKKAVLALLGKEPTFTRRLSAKLIELFGNSEQYTDDEDEDEDRKNL